MSAAVETRAAPEERGTLDLRLRAVERAARQAALDVPGSVRHEGLLARVNGGLPRASVTLQAGSCHVEVDVAAVWPAPVADLAARVRTAVFEQTSRTTGAHVTAVDVTVHAVTGGGTQPGHRRVL